MSDDTQDVEITGGKNFAAFLLIFVALCLHLFTVYHGYQFILWQFEQSAAANGNRRALITCWDYPGEEDEEEDNEDGSAGINDDNNTEGVTLLRTNCVKKKRSLSHPQAAFVMTTSLWMLMFGAVSGCWHWGVLIVIMLVTFFILAKYYLKGGHEMQQTPKQQGIMILGYLTCSTFIATTAAYLLWFCHARFKMDWYGGPPAGHVAITASIAGTIASLGLSLACAAIYYHDPERRQNNDNRSVATDCETTFSAMKE